MNLEVLARLVLPDDTIAELNYSITLGTARLDRTFWGCRCNVMRFTDHRGKKKCIVVGDYRADDITMWFPYEFFEILQKRFWDILCRIEGIERKKPILLRGLLHDSRPGVK